MTEFERAADDMQADLEEMEEGSRRVEQDIEETRADWRRKQDDSAVPGAEPDDHDQVDRRPPPDEMERQGPG